MALPPDSCLLYAVNLYRAARHSKFMQVITKLTDGSVTKESLLHQSKDERNRLYVLHGPPGTWNSEFPIIYAAIQVYLEGYGVLGCDDTDEGAPPACLINDILNKHHSLRPFGASILHFHSLEGYEDASLEKFRKFCEEDTLEPPPRDVVFDRGLSFVLMRYIGIFVEPSLNEYDRWISHGFLPVFIGDSADGRVMCLMISTLDAFEEYKGTASHATLLLMCQEMFVNCLKRNHTFDHTFVMRIMKMSEEEEVRATDLKCTKKERGLVFKFLKEKARYPSKENAEFLCKAMHKLAYLYFTKKFQMSLSEIEQSVLLLYGLQKRSLDDIQRVVHINRSQLLDRIRNILGTTREVERLNRENSG